MDTSFLINHGLVWEVCPSECNDCGREEYKVNVRVVDSNVQGDGQIFVVSKETDAILPLATCYTREDAIAFINNIKKAGIIVNG